MTFSTTSGKGDVLADLRRGKVAVSILIGPSLCLTKKFIQSVKVREKDMLKKIDHLGIAVRSIAEARKFYEQALGMVCEGEEVVESQGVRTAFFAIGETHIELLEPTSAESPIAKFLEKKGEGVHHVAYLTDDINVQLDRARAGGCRLIHENPVPGAGGKQVAFLHPKSSFGVLTELCVK